MHAILASDEAVGFLPWSWDTVYQPLIGCFADGALIASGSCAQPPEAMSEPASLRLANRIAQRLRRAARLPPSLGRPPIAGPSEAVWFRIPLPAQVAHRLRAGDPTVRLERLEDGAPCPAQGEPCARSSVDVTVEDLLAGFPGPSSEALDGFAAFMTLPPLHQLEVVFMEYLRRLPEAEGRHVYLPRMESGEMTALGLRNILVQSNEFKARRIGHGSRLGAGLVSNIWLRLSKQPRLTARA